MTKQQVDDQMKLLQNSWSDLLVLDHMHQRMHNGLPDEMTLANGQKFDLLTLALLGVPSTADAMNQVQHRFLELKLDSLEYLCLKFLLLLNPGKAATIGIPSSSSPCVAAVSAIISRSTLTPSPNQNLLFFFPLSFLPAAADVRGLSNYKLVRDAHDQTQQALLEYTVNNYPQIPVSLAAAATSRSSSGARGKR